MLELARAYLPERSRALIARLGGERVADVTTPDGATMWRFSIATTIRPPV
ncbi:MAG: hypothetical protein ACM31C_03270 [Acidobacteriota bacterium]